MIAGMSLALTSHTTSPSNTLSAAELPVAMAPIKSIAPMDLQLPTVNETAKDTVLVHVHDTVYTPVQKSVKAVRRKSMTKKQSIAPDTIPAEAKQDTLYVPALYIIVPLEHLHESNDTLIAERR